jgi:hypothetical protein
MLQFTKRMHNTLITIVGIALLAISSTAFADEDSSEKPSFAPKVPHPTNGTTECVEPEDDMKKNHMNYILHQRDETMHEGIRTKKYSLKECINCHIPEDSTARFGDSQHFCSSCHNFVGVSIDCFQCHMDRPMDKKASGENPHNAAISKPESIKYVSKEIADTSTEGAQQ